MLAIIPYPSPELEYTAYILFKHLLGLHYEVQYQQCDKQRVFIRLSNGKELVLAASPWLAEPVYDEMYIPQKIHFFRKADNPFIPEKDLPILFGEAEMICHEQKITLNADIFSSAFFMLSRWEESVVGIRDAHGRFPLRASLASKGGFYQRPIVNEYAEMLWNMLEYLGIDQKRGPRHFRPFVTHDVDNPLKWRGPHTLLRTLGGDMLKRRSVSLALHSWKSYWHTKKQTQADPYDTFDYLMTNSERRGISSHFFFLFGGRTSFDREALPIAHPFVKNTLKKIEERGHVVGFHPSYATLTNQELFNRELEVLQQAVRQPIVCGRQHYLRFEVPNTWRFWEEAGLQWDSTMVYPEMPGFRCGICQGFPVFDISTRKMLGLHERPLTLMEVSWIYYQKQTPENFVAEAARLIQTVRKYNGEFVLLWHNSTLTVSQLPQAKNIYEKILSLICDA